MFWRIKRQCVLSGEADSGVSAYCSLFLSKMGQLYWLAYVLTADHPAAEECYMHGLERCLESPHVIPGQENAWARRMIIKNAIHMVSPFTGPGRQASDRRMWRRFFDEWPTSALLALDASERFPFVMSVLEQYSVQECAVLLSCCPAQVVEGKTRALRQIGSAALARMHSAIAMNSNNQARIGRML